MFENNSNEAKKINHVRGILSKRFLGYILNSIEFLEEFCKGMTRKEYINDRLYERGPIPANLTFIFECLERLKEVDRQRYGKEFYKKLAGYDKRKVKKPLRTFSNFLYYKKIGKATKEGFADLLSEPIWNALTTRLTEFKREILLSLDVIEKYLNVKTNAGEPNS